MATMNSGLGGVAGYGENTFSTTPKAAGNNDDGSVNIDVTSVFGAGGINFFGTSYTSVFLNTNGTISFGSAFTDFSTTNLSAETTPLLAPFFADVDITKGGEIYWDLDPVAGTVTMTWNDVARYSGGGTNSFQVVLTSTGGGNFTLEYVYEDIQWAGSGSDIADIGYTDGGGNDVILDGSGNSTEILSYETNDFLDGDPAGTYQISFVGGAPASLDGLVEGTGGDDVIDGTYADDPEGDVVDGGDGTGPGGNADDIRAGAGNDSVSAGVGDDTVYGGSGNDTIDGGDGADLIQGEAGDDSIGGGDGADTIHGGSATTPTATPEHLSWIAEGADTTDISGGFMQDVGGMNVSVGFTNDGGNTAVQTSSDAQYIAGGPYASGSGLYLAGGAGPNVTASLTFDAEPGSGLSDTVSDVTFRINDIDASGWRDVITVTAFDANGNPVTVTFTPFGNDTFSGNTITAGAGNDSATSANGSVEVTIAGPVHTIQIIYSNSSGSSQALWITDVHYTTVPAVDGDDVIDGGAGDDVIYAGVGADTIRGGAGNDTIDLGAGDGANDVIALDDGDGGDLITGFVAPTPNGDGTFTGYDRFDVSELTDANGNSIKVWDVVVTDTNGDGTGDAILTFPNGESVTLAGVTPDQVDSAAELNAIGIPCFTHGTRIVTERGEVAVQDLRVGDRVATLDHGLQPIRWVGGRRVAAIGPLAPVLIPAGSLGNIRDLRVSPQHRMLVTGWQAELLFGDPEVLVAARHLAGKVGIRSVTGGEVEYVHLLFDRHEVIFAEGAPSESFHPGDQGLGALDRAARDEVLALFPDLVTKKASGYGAAARRCLKAHEAALLILDPEPTRLTWQQSA